MKLSITLAALLSFLTVSVNGFGRLCGSDGSDRFESVLDDSQILAPPANYKVAFLGDAGSGSGQKNVLTMVKNWGAKVVIHSGDFEYADNPALFESNINAVLGDSFPYFASIGNHDANTWTGTSGHQARLINRMKKFGGDRNCSGDYGVNMACTWNGLYFVLSGVGTRGSGHVNYINSAFASKPSIWKFVSWHKNQKLMQIGGKSDETGWDVYDATRQNGAILVTAHEHSYCRSYVLSNFRSQTIVSKNTTMNIKAGESFVFVSGLAGQSIRSWDSTLKSNPWWASVAASNNGVDDGALLCTFNIDGNPRKAHCTFKDTNNRVFDDFDIFSSNPGTIQEHQSSLLQEKTCRSPWIEIPISGPSFDAQEQEDGTISCQESVLSLKKSIVTSLQFEKIPLKKGTVVKHAYLQVYGASEPSESPSFIIQGAKGGVNCEGPRFQLSRSSKKTSSAVVWDKEDEGWERHTVWVSPDLQGIVNEIISEEGWEEGKDITLHLTGVSDVSFYSSDYSPCFAPTLAIELEEQC